ncbi:MAG: hypothetical protein ACYDEV_06845 [Acidiferrobacter sp.]
MTRLVRVLRRQFILAWWLSAVRSTSGFLLAAFRFRARTATNTTIKKLTRMTNAAYDSVAISASQYAAPPRPAADQA